MKIDVVAFGIAKDIIKSSTWTAEVSESASVADVRVLLLKNFPAFSGLVSLQLAVNAEYVEDSFVLNENDEVVIIPPVSGG